MHGGVDNYSHNIDIDFSVNLNPFVLPDRKRQAVDEAIAEGIAHAGSYPDLFQRDVRAAVAAMHGVGDDLVIAGNGASELIMAAVPAFAPKKALLIEPAYSGYERALCAAGCEIMRYRLKEEDGFNLTDDVLSHITEDIEMIFLQDPWNPVGKNIDEALLRQILDKTDSLGITTVLDESFYLLSDKSGGMLLRDMRQMLERYRNLLVISSFTKSFALPGIRMGYAVSLPENIDKLSRSLPEWNLSCIASPVMPVCAKITASGDFLLNSVEYIKTEREYLTEGLKDLGLKVYESDTVFVMFKCEASTDLYGALLQKKILIRDLADMSGLGRGFYRVAVRNRDDSMRLIDAIGEALR